MTQLTSAILLLLIGPAIGSFLGVVIDRFGREGAGSSIVTARSRCRSCNTPLGATELIPLVSYLIQLGRCRHCRAAIPAQLFYLEILGLGGAALALAAYPFDPALAWGWALWLWVLIGLAGCDLRWLRLPDGLTAILAITSLILAPNLSFALWGAALGAGSFLALRLIYARLRGREGLGLGDVKLMFGLGAFTGPLDLPLLALIAALLALGLATVTHRRGANLSTQAVPFGAALCVAAALLWLWRFF